MINFQNILNIIINKLIVPTICLVFFASINNLGAIEYQTFTLKNGLKAYIFKTPNPIITYAIAYNVGSMDEEENQQGIAHYLEHTMFLGTNRYSKKEYANLIKKMGAYYNAFTSYDITLYYTSLPNIYLKTIMKIEADRMRWLKIENIPVTNEKKVINEERNMYNNKPYNQFYDVARRAIFPTTNYGRTVIGNYNTFQQITPAELRNFYEKWYTPNNANIFIIGNVNFNEVEAYLNKYYTNLQPARTINKRNNYLEPAYLANYTLEYKNDNIKQDVILKSYNVPSLISDTSKGSKEAYALVVISKILQSKANILYKDLVLDKKLAVDVSIDYDPFAKGNTDFSITVIPQDGISASKVIGELNLTLAQIARRGFSRKEIAISSRKIKDELELLQEDDNEYLFTMARYINAGVSVEEVLDLPNKLSATKVKDINLYYKRLLRQHYVLSEALKK
ncbi:putative Zn-dependent peptidase [Candidatus Hepatincola sp. Pdp]